MQLDTSTESSLRIQNLRSLVIQSRGRFTLDDDIDREMNPKKLSITVGDMVMLEAYFSNMYFAGACKQNIERGLGLSETSVCPDFRAAVVEATPEDGAREVLNPITIRRTAVEMEEKPPSQEELRIPEAPSMSSLPTIDRRFIASVAMTPPDAPHEDAKAVGVSEAPKPEVERKADAPRTHADVNRPVFVGSLTMPDARVLRKDEVQDALISALGAYSLERIVGLSGSRDVYFRFTDDSRATPDVRFLNSSAGPGFSIHIGNYEKHSAIGDAIYTVLIGFMDDTSHPVRVSVSNRKVPDPAESRRIAVMFSQRKG